MRSVLELLPVQHKRDSHLMCLHFYNNLSKTVFNHGSYHCKRNTGEEVIGASRVLISVSVRISLTMEVFYQHFYVEKRFRLLLEKSHIKSLLP